MNEWIHNYFINGVKVESNLQCNRNNETKDTFPCTSFFSNGTARFETDTAYRKDRTDETTAQHCSMSPSILVLTVSNKVFTFIM